MPGFYDGCTGIILEFPQTSNAWRREHGGPDEWIMAEFAVPLLKIEVEMK